MNTTRLLQLRYSDDGGRNWTQWREVDLGALGAYQKRVRFRRLGASLSRIFQIRVSAPIKRDVMGAAVQMSVTES